MKIIAAAIIALSSFAATAGEWHATVHTVSHHFSERTNGKQWNERNLGAGLRYQIDATMGVQVGAYRNSIGKTTTYAIAEWAPLNAGPVGLGVFAGVRTGYTSAVQPAAGAFARWENLTVRLAPKSGRTGSAMVSVEFSFKL